MELSFVHSSNGHSATSLVNSDQSTSVIMNCTSAYASEKNIDAILEKPEQRLGGGPLRRTDCNSTMSSSPYKTVTNDRKNNVLAAEKFINDVNGLNPALVDEKHFHLVNNQSGNGSYQVHQNRQYISIKSQNKTMHFVNINNNLFNGMNVNSTDEVYNSQSMAFDPTLPSKITFQLAPTASPFNCQNNNMVMEVNEPLSEFQRHKEQASESISQLSGSVNTVPDMLCNQLNFNEEQNLASQISFVENTSGMYDASSVSSLLKDSNISVQSNLYNGINYSQNLNLYPQVDGYNNYQLPSSISSYNNGANTSVYNDLGNLNSKSSNEVNGLRETVTSLDDLKNISPMEILDSVKTAEEEIFFSALPQNTMMNHAEFLDTDSSGGINAKTMTAVNHNSAVSAFVTNNGHEFPGPTDCYEFLPAPAGNEEIPLNKELYNELESFFTKVSNSSSDMKAISEFCSNNSTYSEDSISSQINTIYHQ